ncbi:hypothetical protein [Pseudomonas sp. NPDC099000]|uniref:hypothetical protein n=1 Tax=Pseudomonas sp. NPDC099000 TaxID=3364488 RepID=UPI00383B1298
MTEQLSGAFPAPGLSCADRAMLEWACDNGIRMTYNAEHLAGPCYVVFCPAERLDEMQRVRAEAQTRGDAASE